MKRLKMHMQQYIHFAMYQSNCSMKSLTFVCEIFFDRFPGAMLLCILRLVSLGRREVSHYNPENTDGIYTDSLHR